MVENQLVENNEKQETVTFEVEDEQNPSIDVDSPVNTPVETSVEEETSTNVQEDTSSELENYSDNVKKRINQLTAKRKQALEESEAAYTYAQQVQQQNEDLKKRISELDQGYIAEYGGRVESQSSSAKKMLKEAYDNGDMDKMAEAQDLISQLAIEKERIRVQKGRQERQAAEPIQQQQAPQRQQRSENDLDPKLESWMSKNPWFGPQGDMFMTRGAQALHEQLVGVEDYDPSSDEYYAEIDRRMRQEMPHKFQDKRQNVQAVAPASNGRSSKSGRKKTVELTPGQVAFATKMKIPLELYAKEVAKLERKAK